MANIQMVKIAYFGWSNTNNKISQNDRILINNRHI